MLMINICNLTVQDFCAKQSYHFALMTSGPSLTQVSSYYRLEVVSLKQTLIPVDTLLVIGMMQNLHIRV